MTGILLFMTRQELRDKMRVSGALERPGRNNPEWKQAFDLYKQSTGDLAVSMECGSCYNKVKQWLTKP